MTEITFIGPIKLARGRYLVRDARGVRWTIEKVGETWDALSRRNERIDFCRTLRAATIAIRRLSEEAPR